MQLLQSLKAKLTGSLIKKKNPKPLVSVIIPTYNWSSVLRYAIESVLWQTFQNFELLVIGDGCTDNTAEVVAAFQDRRIRWYNLVQNSGTQSTPNNTGLEMAQGDYIAYLGHDDVWYPTHLATLTDAMVKTGADVAYTVMEMIGPPGSNRREMTGFSISGHYERGQVIPPSSVMHKRRMERDIGYWKDFRTLNMPPDLEFLARAYDHSKKFIAVYELTVFKFNSAWRPNSYIEKPCDQQAEYVQRIKSESDFLYRELLEFVKITTLPLPRQYPEIPEPPNPMPPGWQTTQSRRIRGLSLLT